MTSTAAFSTTAAFEPVLAGVPDAVVERHESAVELAREMATGLDGTAYTSGLAPTTVCATAIYVAPLIVGKTYRLSQPDVAEWTGVSVPTIGTHYKELPAAYAAAVDGGVPDRFRENIRGWLRHTRDLWPDDFRACPACAGTVPLFGVADASRHYSEKHPFERFDPVWFAADGGDD